MFRAKEALARLASHKGFGKVCQRIAGESRSR
jgi:hypothetical protein